MKSIEEYKQIVKQLKLQVKKLQIEKQELSQLQKYQSDSFLTNKQAVLSLENSLQRIGVNAEMLFRMADVHTMEIVTNEQLSKALFNIARLTPQCIQQLLNLFDVDKSGSITRSEYYQSLEIFGINQESSLSYLSTCFAKFVKLVDHENFGGRIGFVKMDPQHKGFIDEDNFIAFTKCMKNYENYLKERDILGAFQYLNTQKDGHIQELDYLKQYEMVRRQHKNINDDPAEEKLDQFRKVLSIKNIRLSDFLLGLLQKIDKPHLGIIYDIFSEYSLTILNKEDTLILYKIMDFSQSGSIDYDELMYFYLLTMKPSDKFDILFLILARKLQAMDMSIEKYLRLEQVYEITQLSLIEFQPIAQTLFSCYNEQQIEQLFNALDMDNSQTVTAKEIITFTNQAVQTLMPSEVINQVILSSQHSTEIETEFITINQNNLEQNQLQPLLKLIKNYKLILEYDDYFEKDQNTTWKTIFNSEIACLLGAVEIAIQLKENQQFQDPEFGPTQYDLQGAKSIYYKENDRQPGWPPAEDLEWVDVNTLNEEWEYLQDGANANDVVQSQYLGNCWFLSALSIISLNDEYIVNGIIPKVFLFLRKYGIYVFRFYKEFKFRYVIVDGRFCCYNHELLFGKCRNANEWWVQFIEKAYAKLHNCYEALTAGDIGQGMQDLIGLPGTKIRIDLKIIQKCQIYNSLMGCSANGNGVIQMDDENTGIFAAHAYGILHYFEINDENMQNERKTHRLLMIRNPWGFGEWKLAWSDQSEQIQQFMPKIDQYFDVAIKQAEDNNFEPPERYQINEDGIFLINFKNFNRIFQNLFICYNLFDWSCLNKQFQLNDNIFPKAGDNLKYGENQQFILDISSLQIEKHLFLQLSQKDLRLQNYTKYPYEQMNKLLLCVFKLNQDEDKLLEFTLEKKIADSKMIAQRRDIDTGIFRVTNGRYAIVMSGEGKVNLRVFFNFPKGDIKSEGQIQVEGLGIPNEIVQQLQKLS